ncbi:MAG: hypothetical protein JWQ98_3507 [Chlorobi bacterium]|nr:hypothetical protein [Chlorobiota bacterium]
MTTRCTFSVRALALLALLAVLFLMPAAGRAQSVDCVNGCDHFTVKVGRLACDLTLCYQLSPSGPTFCLNLAAGSTTRVPCTNYQAWINTCSGPYYLIPSTSAALCSPILKFAAGCCGQICNAPSTDHCTVLDITPAPCSSDACP